MKTIFFLALLFSVIAGSSYAQSELITNSDFNNGTSGWWIQGADVTSANGEITFNITNPGTNIWGVQMLQGGLTLKKGYKYTLSWRVKRDSGEIAFHAQLDHDPYTILFGTTTNQDGSWKEGKMVYENYDEDFSGAGVSSQFGGNTTAVTFDYISLKEDLITPIDTNSVSGDPSTINTNPGFGPVSYYGQMQVMGNKILGSRTQAPVQVKGISFYWSIWHGEEFYNTGAVNALVKDWKTELIRIPMAVESNDDWQGIYGYLDPRGRDTQIKYVETLIDAAIAKDIYVLIDYHSHDADTHTQNAIEFFDYMAKKYGKYDNVIFEIYNEPKEAKWPAIKTYSETVIQTIRKYSDNLVIVGTENYSQRVDVASFSPINDSNVAYVFHFYSPNKISDRAFVTTALSNNVALFASEWGNGDANEINNESIANSDIWHELLDAYKISSANWCVYSKDLGTFAGELPLFDPKSGIMSRTGEGWGDTTNMSVSGLYVYNMLQKQAQKVKWRKVMQVPNAPLLVLPVTNSKKSNVNVTFFWRKIRNAEKYYFQLSDNDQFTTIIKSDTILMDTTSTVDGLLEGQKYYWRVQAKNSAGSSPWSYVSNFSTILSTPTELVLQLSKANEITLSWKDNSSNETGYLIERKQNPQTSFSLLDTLKGSGNKYVDKNVEGGHTYTYRTKAYTIFSESNYSNEASLVVTDVTDVAETAIPEEYSISQNYPNPFNPTTKIKFGLPQSVQTKLTIYDILGREVQTLINKELKAGYHEISFEASSLSTGIYFYRIQAGRFTDTKKFILLR